MASSGPEVARIYRDIASRLNTRLENLYLSMSSFGHSIHNRLYNSTTNATNSIIVDDGNENLSINNSPEATTVSLPVPTTTPTATTTECNLFHIIFVLWRLICFPRWFKRHNTTLKSSPFSAYSKFLSALLPKFSRFDQHSHPSEHWKRSQCPCSHSFHCRNCYSIHLTGPVQVVFNLQRFVWLSLLQQIGIYWKR